VTETVTVMSQASVANVTNVQHAGVDEGGIVKVHGRHLVVLRRGRLFTVELGSLRPVASIDAFGPGIDPSYAWYDEMLISEDRIVVVGYSYARGGTELVVFEIDAAGRLRYRDTYHLRSNDYYSARNYASRLIGRTLVFYTPLTLPLDAHAPLRGMPAMRRWEDDATEAGFRPIYTPRRIYGPALPLTGGQATLHTVTTCDLAGAKLDCRATGVMGPEARVFYVSGAAVYVWMSRWNPHGDWDPRSVLCRMPLTGGDPRAVFVSGGPVDQFSFLEEAAYLNVLLRSNTAGDAMWRSERAQSAETALLRLPLSAFREEIHEVAAARYRNLPGQGNDGAFHNRFVGDYVLYGTGDGWFDAEDEDTGTLHAVRFRDGDAVHRLRLGHSVDRIEAMGSGALVVGTTGDDEDLGFSTIALGREPRLVDRYLRRHAAQAETRSHGFFYKAQGRGRGMLGLPVAAAGRPGYEHLFQDAASVLFLRDEALHLRELGELAPQPEEDPDDGCRASCVDWYGNARPLFVGERIFALLGYELVEGRLADGRIQERRRASFAPANKAAAR
jgi:beta propeller domain-containing protein